MNQGTHFTGTKNQGTHFTGTKNQGTHFTGTKNQGTHFTGTMNQGTHFTGTKNQGTHFTGTKNQGTHFTGTKNQGTHFTGTKNQGTHFTGTKNQGTHFTGTKNQGTHFTGTKNQGTHFTGELHIVGQGVPKGSEGVSHELVPGAVPHLLQVSLQVGPGALGPGSDGHGPALVVVGGRARLVDVRAILVIACHQEPHAVRALVVALGGYLGGGKEWFSIGPRTTVSQDVQTWFPVQLAFAKFLSKIKGNF